MAHPDDLTDDWGWPIWPARRLADCDETPEPDEDWQDDRPEPTDAELEAWLADLEAWLAELEAM